MTRLISAFFQPVKISQEVELVDGFWCPVEGCGRDFATANARAVHMKFRHPNAAAPPRCQSEPTATRKRLSYDQKGDVLRKFQAGFGVRDLERVTGIPHSTISDWVKKKDKIMENLQKGNGHKKMVGGGRKRFFPRLK